MILFDANILGFHFAMSHGFQWEVEFVKWTARMAVSRLHTSTKAKSALSRNAKESKKKNPTL